VLTFTAINTSVRFLVVFAIMSMVVFGFVCPSMAHHAVIYDAFQKCCDTSISKNIEAWKDTLLVAPREMRDGLPTVILGLIAKLAFGLFGFRSYLSDYRLQFYRLYARDNPDFPLFNHLKFAFAQGILNPKIY